MADAQISSPRKRKAQGPPAGALSRNSPPLAFGGGSSTASTPMGRRRAHSRTDSEVSGRGPDSYSRHSDRHRHTGSLVSSRSGVSPTHPPSLDSTPSGGIPYSAGARGLHGNEQADPRRTLHHERRALPPGPDMKIEEGDSAEPGSSSRTSSKREESRD